MAPGVASEKNRHHDCSPAGAWLCLDGHVVDKAGAAVRVVKPEWLSEDLPKEKPVLTNSQIDLIARQLDAECRDVED